MKPSVIAITPGEPAGIGPDIVLQALAASYEGIRPVIIADPEMMEERAAMLGLPAPSLREVEPGPLPPAEPGSIDILPVPLVAPATCGELEPRNSAYVLTTLDAAVKGCRSGDYDALVTGPVHKGVINEAGFDFSGHTEYLATHCDCDDVVMMLATEGLRVALATTHLPLSDVPAAITRGHLERCLDILAHDLQRHFGIASPRLLVCGLNPHAGEGGHLGREEIDTIIPALDACRARGMQIEGPLPADTLFKPDYLNKADAVLAMYHDQGLPVLKYKGFGRAVNITLGLPMIRTSVDHGTALDLAGSGRADSGSLLTAIDYAADMAQRARPHE